MRVTKSKVIGLALNLRENCDYCIPCWNTILNEKFHPEKVDCDTVDTNFDQLIEQLDKGRIPKPHPEAQCQFYVNSGRDLLLGAKADFFHPTAKDTAMKVLELLEIYPEVSARARVLTKTDISMEIPRFPVDMWVGASITTLSGSVSKAVQPNAANPKELIEMLQDAHDLGFPTWVVVEPFYKYMDLWKLIDDLQFVKEMWVGRLNGGRDKPVTFQGKELTCGDLAEKDTEIVRQFKLAKLQLKDAVVQKDIVQEDGNVLYDQSTPFVYNLYPKKEIRRLLEKSERAERSIN